MRKSIIEKPKRNWNRKGNVAFMLWFFIAIFLIMFAGFIMVMVSSVTNFVFDEWVPAVDDLGTVEGTGINFTDISSKTIVPLNDVVQSFTWIAGIVYVFFLLGIVMMAFMFSVNPNKLLIGLFFGFIFLVVIASIFMSQIYQDFYDDNDEIGNILKEHKLLSFLILHSPVIITTVSLIAGVLFFSGLAGDEGV